LGGRWDEEESEEGENSTFPAESYPPAAVIVIGGPGPAVEGVFSRW
jgi:hypothetical protein